MPLIELVIFDCDGVLVDSELIACSTVSKCLSEAGITLSAEEVISSYTGVSTSTMINDFNHRFGPRLPSNFPEMLQDRTREAFERELKAVDGARDALLMIPFRACVASSA
jgi:beta-phosphoglucomutase-like phosphatase (HAD superfamily)